MTWTYSVSTFDTTTSDGRRNSVRLLIGDTNTNDQQVQDEEIAFALTEKSNNIYYAASWLCNAIASKYGRLVDTQLDGALESKYSQMSKNYRQLATMLAEQGRTTSGTSIGVFAGGISVAEIDSVRLLADRPKPVIYEGQFDNPGTGFLPEEY
jgi:hypothetical protein